MDVGQTLDSALALIAPRYALTRARARHDLEVLNNHVGVLSRHVRRFEAAARTRRTQGWRALGTDANAEVGSSLTILRDRHRQLVRDNAWAGRACRVIDNNVVGTGILAKPDTQSAQTRKRAADLWKAWAEDPDAIDAEGRADFYGLQSLIMRAVTEGGECLIRRIRVSSGDGLPVPLRIQVLEADYLDVDKEGTAGAAAGNRIIQGVEVTPLGRRAAFWIFDNHPGASERGLGMPTSSRVSADNIVHVYRPDRVGQVRGVAWGAAAMLRLLDFGDLEDAYIVRAKLAACLVGVIHDLPGSELGGTPSTTTTSAEGFLEDGTTLRPGLFRRAPPGTSVEWSSPPGIDGYADFNKITLREVAATYDVAYSSLTGDLESVNFSSGRMGWIEQWQSTEAIRWRYFIPHACRRVYGWFVEGAVAVGRLQDPTLRAIWTPPRREMLDPTKEVPALIKSVRGGLKSLQEALREMGYDVETVLAELASDFSLAHSLGLKLESDPANGPAQAPAAASSSSPIGKAKEDGQGDEESEEPEVEA